MQALYGETLRAGVFEILLQISYCGYIIHQQTISLGVSLTADSVLCLTLELLCSVEVLAVLHMFSKISRFQEYPQASLYSSDVLFLSVLSLPKIAESSSFLTRFAF
jgi:hypothetical protein